MSDRAIHRHVISVHPDPGSFRDPGGRVYVSDDRVFRTVMSGAYDDFRSVSGTGVYQDLIEKQWLLPFAETSEIDLGLDAGDPVLILESRRLDVISYPFEWSFSALKTAALLHIDIHLSALEYGVTLSDATAYNIQFIGPEAVFIDHLSFKPYSEGEYWRGHRQFCEQFLNPLLLRAKCGIPHNDWYRGALEGISSSALSRVLPWYQVLSPRLLMHVVLPARFERLAIKSDTSSVSTSIRNLPFKLPAFRKLLNSLRAMISDLHLPGGEYTVWSQYAELAGYSDPEKIAKRSLVEQFVKQVRPKLLWDIGCNTGDYSQLALTAGAKQVVGFESDIGALDLAYDRAVAENLRFLPLFMDIANPSPAQGWRQSERMGLAQRGSPDAILALAVLHHLCIGRNIPLDDAVEFLVGVAPQGVIEFVPKEDPKVQQLLSMREDIFHAYNEESFLHSLSSRSRLVKAETITKSGRKLVWYDREE